MFLAAFIWIKQQRKRMPKTDKTAENKGKTVSARAKVKDCYDTRICKIWLLFG